MTTVKESDKERIVRITKETVENFYTAQYKAAFLGLIQFSQKTPDQLADEVHVWLHYEVDNFSDPMKESPWKNNQVYPLNCPYGIDTLPCEDCDYGGMTNRQIPCNECHHAKSCMFKQKEVDE